MHIELLTTSEHYNTNGVCSRGFLLSFTLHSFEEAISIRLCLAEEEEGSVPLSPTLG